MIKKSIYLFGALILPLLVVWIFRMQYGYIYHAVDDVTINYSIINGESMLLPYIGIVLTKTLVIIQNIFPMINIYFIFLVGTYSISFSVFIFLLRKRKCKILLIVIILIIEFTLLKYFTYSVVAYVLATSGVLLLYKEEKTILSSIIIFVGFSLRVQVIVSVILLLLGIVLYELIVNKKKEKTVYLAIVTTLVIATNFIFVKTNSEVENYITWNNKSTLIRDYPAINYNEYKDKLASENISKNDLESYNAWIFAEKNVFSNNMLDKLDEIRDNSKKYDLSIKNNIIQIFSNELLKVFIYFIVLIPLLYRPKKIFGHLSLVMPIALIVLLSIRQRMVERVYIPLIIIFIFSFIIYLQDIFEKRNYRLLRGTENIIFSILSLIMLNNTIQYGTDNLYWFVHQSFPHNKVYNELLKNNEKNLYIFAGYGNIINSQPNVSKVFVEKDKLTKNMLTLGNWQTFTPQYKEKLDDLNVSDSNNLLSSALDSDNIKFVLPEKSGLMEKVKTLFKEHYNKDVNFMFQDKIDEEVNVYVLRSDVSE